MSATNTITFTGFIGRQRVTLTLAENSDDEMIHDLLRKLAVAQAMGFTTHEVELPPATETQQIDTVVLRYVQNSDGSHTPVVDCYPQWNSTGTFGQYRWGFLYLNTPDDVAQFEAASGVQLRQLQSLGLGVAPLQRRHGQRHPDETTVRPFTLAREKTGTDEQGKPRYKYSLFNSEAAATNVPWHLTPTLDEVKRWGIERGHARNPFELDELIAPRRWWQFASAREAADAIVAAAQAAPAQQQQQQPAQPPAQASQPPAQPPAPPAQQQQPAPQRVVLPPGTRPVLPDEEGGVPW